MRRIFTLGETVFDIIFKNDLPQTCKPGGAMLNTAVSLGRLSLPVYLISEYAEDHTGKLIDGFLTANGVSAQYIHHYCNGKTPLALAFLDEQNNASYTFYKIYPEERLAIVFPDAGSEDIILFGSIYSVTHEIRGKLMAFIKESHKKAATIIYDPNIRKTGDYLGKEVFNMVSENIHYSSVVRASDEDCKALFDVNDGESAYKRIKEAGCRNLIYTSGGKKVELFTEQICCSYCLPEINTISTIGAGDTFNAGLIYSFIKSGIDYTNIDKVTEDVWKEAIENAVAFASDVCMSYDNYISQGFAERLVKKININ